MDMVGPRRMAPPAKPGMQVLGLYELHPQSVHEHDFIFSITDHTGIKLPFPADPSKVLRMTFMDTECPLGIEKARMQAAVITALQTAKLMDLTPEHRVIVHCHAGISRSSALAWALLVQMGYEIEVALSRLERDRPIILPNRGVLAIADDHLRLGGRLSKAGAEARTTRAQAPDLPRAPWDPMSNAAVKRLSYLDSLEYFASREAQ